MSGVTRCPSCGGRKKVIGMGLIEKDCGNCKGVGFINVQDAEIIETVNGLASEPVIVTKRRGRPKRELEANGSR